MVQADLFGRVPEVIIDSHEITIRKKDTSVTIFIDMLRRENIYYRIEKLDIGDILLPSSIVIERKTVKDFCQSLFGTREGRLRLLEQIKKMIKTYETPILLLEGGLSVRPDPINKAIYVPITRKKIGKRLWSVVEEEIRIHPNQFEGAIKEIESMGVRVIKSFDELHGAILLMRLLKEAKEKARLEKRNKYPVVRSKPKLRTLEEQQLFFLSGLPGISIARAKKILEMYKTPYNAILKVKRWDVDIEGIGPSTLDRVMKVLFTEFGSKSEKNKIQNAD